jgi:hypothetical protein
MVVTDNGYWLVAADGGVFALGDAPFHGSASSATLAAPIVSLTPTTSLGGYTLLSTDGAVIPFGDAPYHGSAQGLLRAAIGLGGRMEPRA